MNELSVFELLKRSYQFVKPFRFLLFITLILNSIFSALSALSVSMIKPISAILFSATSKPAQAIASTNLENSFYSYLESFYNVPNDIPSTLYRLSVMIVIVFAIKNIVKYIGSVQSQKLEEKIIKFIRDRVFSHLTSLSIEFFIKNKQGNLISTLTNDIATLNSSTVSSFNTLLRESIQIILYLALLFSISAKLTLIAFSTSIISLIVINFAQKYLKKYASRMQVAMADYTSTMQEALGGIRVIKAYNAENSISEKFANDTNNYVVSSVKHNKIMSLIPAFNEVFAIIALTIVLTVGGLEVVQAKTIKADDLMAFLFSLFAIMSPISTTVNTFSGFQRGTVAGQRIFSILDTNPKVEDGTHEKVEFTKSLSLSNISFAYQNENVLKNISIEIKKGQKIAFVGGSGSGKSTMLDLITRFYDPQTGIISLDNKNIKDLKIKGYRDLFGIVSQENILFNDTIANNIKFGMQNVSMNDLEEVAKLSNSYNFIMNQSEKFETRIGDRGVSLSGGERQRIAIARALLRKPEILIFDEATSALDAESEKIVQEAINKSLENRTAIIVAHRLSTIIDCDTIYVFDKGNLIESGSHQTLLEMNGIYKKLYDIQFSSNISL